MRKLLLVLCVFGATIGLGTAPAFAAVCHPTTITAPTLPGGILKTTNHIYCDIPVAQINIHDRAFNGDAPITNVDVVYSKTYNPPYTVYGDDFNNGINCAFWSHVPHWYGHTVWWHVDMYDGEQWEGGPTTSSGTYGTCT